MDLEPAPEHDCPAQNLICTSLGPVRPVQTSDFDPALLGKKMSRWCRSKKAVYLVFKFTEGGETEPQPQRAEAQRLRFIVRRE